MTTMKGIFFTQHYIYIYIYILYFFLKVDPHAWCANVVGWDKCADVNNQVLGYERCTMYAQTLINVWTRERQNI